MYRTVLGTKAFLGGGGSTPGSALLADLLVHLRSILAQPAWNSLCSSDWPKPPALGLLGAGISGVHIDVNFGFWREGLIQ